MQIHNNGPVLTSTDYWSTEAARAGLMYLSINAGSVRVLVPSGPHRGISGSVLDELPPVGVPVELTRTQGGEVYEIAWLDDPDYPYVLVIDAQQSDRLIPCSEAGRVVPLVIYGPDSTRGPESVRVLRSEQATFRCR